MVSRLSTLIAGISLLLVSCNSAQIELVAETPTASEAAQPTLTVTSDIKATQTEAARLVSTAIPGLLATVPTELLESVPDWQTSSIPELDEHFNICDLLSSYHVDFIFEEEDPSYRSGVLLFSRSNHYACAYLGDDYTLEIQLLRFDSEERAAKSLGYWMHNEIYLRSLDPLILSAPLMGAHWKPVTEEFGTNLYFQHKNILLDMSLRSNYEYSEFINNVSDWQPAMEGVVETFLMNLYVQSRPVVQEPDPDFDMCALLKEGEVETLSGVLHIPPHPYKSTKGSCIYEGEFNTINVGFHWLPTIEEADQQYVFKLHASRVDGLPAKIPYAKSSWKVFEGSKAGGIYFQYSNAVLHLLILPNRENDNHLGTPDDWQLIMEELAILLIERLPEVPLE